MPIYEYRCRKCGFEFEKMQRFSDQPVKKCPECSGRVDKLVSQSSFRLKGTGWYATDYGKKSHGGDKPKRKQSQDKSGGEKSDTNKADSKKEPAESL